MTGRRTPNRPSCAVYVVVAATMLVVLGCAQADDFARSTLPPLTEEQLRGTTSTVADVLGTAPGPRIPDIVGEGCVLGDPPATGAASVTYTIGASVFELGTDGATTTCVIDNVLAPPGEMRWTPGGSGVLLGSGTLRNQFGSFGTQLADDAAVQWTYPRGEFLLSIDDGKLRRRQPGSGTSPLTLRTMSSTSAVAAHPDGEHLLVAGTRADGTGAIVLAALDGTGARAIVTVPDASPGSSSPTSSDGGATVSEISVATSGDQYGFVVTAGARWVLFIGRFPDLTLGRILDSREPLEHLTQSPSGALAVRAGDCDAAVHTQVFAGERVVDLADAPAFVGRSVEPVGWWDATRLVLLVRDEGCEGVGDLWVADAVDLLSPMLLVSSVERAAIRRGPVSAPPADQGLAANPTPAELG